MRKILLSVFSITFVIALAVGATLAQFSDTETVTGNTFSAGSINLKVDGSNEPITAKFTTDNMKPGNMYDAGCVTLSNTGTLAGDLSVIVSNLVSNENSLIEPETSDGDTASTEVDPTGYDNNAGDGELWDQITIKLCLDDGTGSHTGNGICDWDDTLFKTFSSTQDDYSSYYSISTDTDLAPGATHYMLTHDQIDLTLDPGESVGFCAAVKFIDDQSTSWWGGQGSLTNNMSMTDDAQFDITFGLTQTP